METARIAAAPAASRAVGTGLSTSADQLSAAMRAAQLARALAEADRHLAEVTERRARHTTLNAAMHLRAARRLRIQAGTHRIEARHQESRAAWLRELMDKSA